MEGAEGPRVFASATWMESPKSISSDEKSGQASRIPDEMTGKVLAQGSGNLAGGPCDPRSHLGLGEFAHRDHANARLEARNPGHRDGDSIRALLAVARRDDPRRVKCPTCRGTRSENGPSTGARLKRVARAQAIGDVDIGPGRLHHNRGERFSAINDGEMSGRPDGVGEQSQSGESDIADDGLHLTPKREDGETEAAASVHGSSQEGVLLKGHDEAVDDGSPNSKGLSDLGNREPVSGLGDDLEYPQPAVERL